MLKTALKNYIKYLKYLLLVFALFLAATFAAGAFFVLGAYLPLQRTYPETSAAMLQFIQSAMQGMELSYFFSSDFFSVVGSGTYEYVATIESGLKTQVIIFMMLAIGAFFALNELGKMLCKRAIRKRYLNEDTLKGLPAVFIRLGFTVISLIVYAIVVYHWSYALLLIPLVSAIVSSLKNIYATYFIYYRKYKFKSFIQKRDVFNILILQTFTVLIEYIIIIVALNLLSVYYLLLIVLPILAYTSVVTSTVTEEYYKDKVEKNNLPLKAVKTEI